MAGDLHELHGQLIHDFLEGLLPTHIPVFGEQIANSSPVPTDGSHQDGAESIVLIQVIVDLILQHAEVELVVSDHKGCDDCEKSGLMAAGRAVDPVATEELAIGVSAVAGGVAAAAVGYSGRAGLQVSPGVRLGEAD